MIMEMVTGEGVVFYIILKIQGVMSYFAVG